ncbi:unnamed protein product [Protopolystoma xenopodis]|uniref:Exportin-2 central domain-containing protein n=1 Tax=Protopolystoma xenopodis TaxID=117903 RepID=A0A448WWJ2_9PLAT|nr:unnamed protein product [Protopolystoma xenopodis]
MPEFFEDTMSEWMLIHCQILQLDPCTTQLVNASASVVSESGIASGFGGSEEAGCLVEHVKSQVCDNIGLYASKYEEEFTPFLSGFVTDVWQMLLTTSQETRFDMLVGNAIEFLSSVVARPQHRHLFESPETLQSLCEKVILPNMHLRVNMKLP